MPAKHDVLRLLSERDYGTDATQYYCETCGQKARSIMEMNRLPCVADMPHWSDAQKKVS